MQWNKVPIGKTISILPLPLQKPALIFRNILYNIRSFLSPHNLNTDKNKEHIETAINQSVEYVFSAGVEGDLSEFGTMTGFTAEIIAKQISYMSDWFKSSTIHSKREAKLHLFDSFEGLPDATSEIDKKNVLVTSDIWRKGSCLGVSANKLRKMCNKHLPDDRIIIYEGWFSDTMPQLSNNNILSLVHIDSDLYQSAMDVLSYLFKNRMIAEGAIILFDDFNMCKASKEYGERKAWSEIVQKHKVDFSDFGNYGCAGWRFVVHNYM
ncbi:MAG TPA: hypothetical protein ENI12_01900 [Nitrospirae bacterium]|nr:hypothetical protein [Nitrospirota bacterium]